MQPVDEVTGPVRVAGAMWVGTTPLIDNVLVTRLRARSAHRYGGQAREPTNRRTDDDELDEPTNLYCPDVRPATVADAPALARIINDAFIVEAFFKIGDRTSAEELVELMNERRRVSRRRCRGEHGRLRVSALPRTSGRISACCPSTRRRQGQGLGRTLIEAVEARARERGCRFMDIHIVNLREELPAYYRRLGYVEQGTLPFSAPERASRPCHFIVMTKPLS